MIIIINIIIDIIDITILQRQLQVDDVHVSDELYGQTGVHPQAEVCMMCVRLATLLMSPSLQPMTLYTFFLTLLVV